MLDTSYEKTYAEDMTDTLQDIVEKNLNLTGKKKESFLREAQALRANIKLRQKQKKERKKCMHSK